MISVNTQHDIIIGYYCRLNTLKLNEEDALATSSKFDAVVCWKPNNIFFLSAKLLTPTSLVVLGSSILFLSSTVFCTTIYLFYKNSLFCMHSMLIGGTNRINITTAGSRYATT